MGRLSLARADDLGVITSAATLVETVHPRINRPALEWTLSRLVVDPVTEPIGRHAAVLLTDADLHGHESRLRRHAQCHTGGTRRQILAAYAHDHGGH